eukprot:TRINITY_DN73916_c0_g1_i1.p1 TRINITY_DN73916_c0_g1~~TRINITY_DN73916_c0_g1_i1.p1  ORF type:complete len:330 (+),score=124.25 TRINITY_DN73916_c0_g1_i1:77-991(+)
MMRKAPMTARVALKSQARTFLPPNVAVTGTPIQVQSNTLSGAVRTVWDWQNIVQPISDASAGKYGAGGARAIPEKCVDPAIDKADVVEFNTYEGGSAVGRQDRFGKEVEELLIGYPNTDEKYIRSILKPRARDEYENRVKFYGLLAVPRAITLFTMKSIVAGLLLSFGPRADMKAASTLEVDLSAYEVGQVKTIMWMGKPVFIHRRTEGQIATEDAVDSSSLRDPQTDTERHINKEFAIMIAICTHLGCIPVSGGGDFNAYLCPCHGSHYDFSGRIRKGPAPLNLEVPPYYYMNDTQILIGASA